MRKCSSARKPAVSEPHPVRTDGGPTETRTRSDEQLLHDIAWDSYGLFEEYETEIGLVGDHVAIGSDANGDRADDASPSNIAMYLLSTVAAGELDIISSGSAAERLERTIETLEGVETWNGLFYRWYDAEDGSLAVDYEDRHISTVDNGHLTAALVVVAQAFPTLHDRARTLADAGDYSSFHSEENGCLIGAYYFARDDGSSGFGDWTYNFINSEHRVASYCAIGKNDMPETHWWQPLRTSVANDPETSDPVDGEWATYDDVEVFEGFHEHEGTRFVPSWGGALFETLMPALFIDESLSGNAWASNAAAHVELHRQFARENDWPVWGLSSCGIPGGYGVFGVPYGGAWEENYTPGPWVTPHATGLAAMVDRAAAAENFRVLYDMGIEGPYGPYDAIHAETGEICEKYYFLDQGMLLCGIVNALTDGGLRRYFHADRIGSRPEKLLERESFGF